MKCIYCLSEGIHVEMDEINRVYGRKIPAPTIDTEPEQEVEYIDWWCPECGSWEREYITEQAE